MTVFWKIVGGAPYPFTKEYIQNNACMSTDADAVMDAMGSAELKGVLRDKNEDLEEIFDALRMQHNTVRNASSPPSCFDLASSLLGCAGQPR